MKNIKLILTAFAAVLIMSTAFAQAPKKGNRGDRMVTKMTEQLDLSEEQVTKITAIQQEFREEMRALRSGAGADTDRTVMRTKMQKVVAEQETAIQAVLNKDQIAKWETAKAVRGQTRPGGINRSNIDRPTKDKPKMDRPVKGKRSIDATTKGKSKPMQRPQKSRTNTADKMQKALDLSDSQATELKAITKAHYADMKALKADGVKKRKFKKAEKKYKADVKNLLTAEQFKKWTSMKEKKSVKQDMLK